jgi:hypothetical protein
MTSTMKVRSWAGRGVGDLVARLDDRVHRGVDADRQPGEAEVVVDRRRHADHPQAQAAGLLGIGEVDRAGQRAVAADHDQPVDAATVEDRAGLIADLAAMELLAPRRAEDRAALAQDAGDLGRP